MGFVGLHFHNASASMAVRHISQKIQKKNSFRNRINLCVFCPKHTLTPYRFLRRGWGKTILVMLVWNHSKSCTPSRDWGQIDKSLSQNQGWSLQWQSPLGLQKISVLKGVSHQDSMSGRSGLATGFTRGNRIKPEPGIKFITLEPTFLMQLVGL